MVTDEQIIKALECCINADCVNCLKWSKEWTSGMCNDFLPSVLDLINRLRAESEKLTYKLECLLCHATGGKLSKSTYTLRTMETVVTDYINESCYEAETEIRAEAIKEFAERLKNEEYETSVDAYSVGYLLGADDIDNLVKEMTEGTE